MQKQQRQRCKDIAPLLCVNGETAKNCAQDAKRRGILNRNSSSNNSTRYVCNRVILKSQKRILFHNKVTKTEKKKQKKKNVYRAFGNKIQNKNNSHNV